MPPALVFDGLVRPEPAHHLDLLFAAHTPIVKVLPERFVFDVVPASADAQPQPAPRQHIDTGGLLCDKRSLPLRQDEDRSHEFQRPRQTRQVAEEHERLKELALRRIGATPLGAACRVGA